MNYELLYDQLPYYDNKVFKLDLLSIKDSQAQRTQMPVVTKKCHAHPKYYFAFIDACNSLAETNQIRCPCGKSVDSLNELIKDIRQTAYEQFHPIVEQVQTIFGFLCHKYNRKKKYLEYISQVDQKIPNFFSSLSSKYQQNDSIGNIIKNRSGNQQKVNFWAYCLLDKVKIIIPVRIKNCQHPECYELTSLLAYKLDENQLENQIFKCLFPGCQQTLNIQTLPAMIAGLVLDHELLRVLNKGFPAQFKFIYDSSNNTFSDGMQIINGVSIDPFILQCYRTMLNSNEQNLYKYADFQYQVQIHITQVMQWVVPDDIEKILKQFKYSQRKDQLIDPVIQQNLEFPIRCIECKDYNRCVDARTFAANFFLVKSKKQQTNKCLLCGFQYNCLSKSICSLIYFDRNLIQQIFLSKEYLQYSLLPETDLTKFTFDKFELLQNIQETVVLKSCNHYWKIQCLTLSEAREQWKLKKQITCPCGQKTNSIDDLKKDVSGQIKQFFQSSVECIQVIQGISTHKYLRKKQFTQDLFYKANSKYPDFLPKMKKKFGQIYSVSQIIKQYSDQDYNLLALCLLDQVKIITPVRILDCKHPECYELTSLLNLWNQSLKNDNEVKYFQCCYPSCKSTIIITSLEDLINGLVLDVDLLSVLNKSSPSQFKFKYSIQLQQFDFNLANGEDPILKKIYHTKLADEDKAQQDETYSDFINNVRSLIAALIQLEINPNEQKILNQDKYRTKTICMTDRYSGELIEFPVRCTKCSYLDEYVDVRSFVANHILAKKRKQFTINCLVCYQEYNLLSTLNSKIVYFDRNLLFRMFFDRSYFQTKVFNYDGKSYLLEWFKKYQKISREEYLHVLAESNEIVGNFSILFCALDPQKYVEIPLIIKYCPYGTIVDFENFYKKMVELNFSIEEQGLCNCQYCSLQPIKSYENQLFYHEALGEALAAKKNSKSILHAFQYDFKQRSIVEKKTTQLQLFFLRKQNSRLFLRYENGYC